MKKLTAWLIVPAACFPLLALPGCGESGGKAEKARELAKMQNEEIMKALIAKQAEKPAIKATQTSSLIISRPNAKAVLTMLGEVKSWTVFPEKNGQAKHPEVVAAIDSGQYERLLKAAFSDRQLELKFFTRLPVAIYNLRNAAPRPERCELTPKQPVAFEPVAKKLGKGESQTTETLPDGRTITWHKYAEISLGVDDDKITTVRLHIAEYTVLWTSARPF